MAPSSRLRYRSRWPGGLDSTVGVFHTAPPAGLYNVTPLDCVVYGCGSSGTTQAFQICLPVFASNATTLPRDVQHG